MYQVTVNALGAVHLVRTKNLELVAKAVDFGFVDRKNNNNRNNK